MKIFEFDIMIGVDVNDILEDYVNSGDGKNIHLNDEIDILVEILVLMKHGQYGLMNGF